MCTNEHYGVTCNDRCDEDPCNECLDDRLPSVGRFWLFMGENYYPSGGMDDFAGGFLELDSVWLFLDDVGFDPRHKWWQLLDTENMTILNHWLGRDGVWKPIIHKGYSGRD
jgi:hypothetical protein